MFYILTAVMHAFLKKTIIWKLYNQVTPIFSSLIEIRIPFCSITFYLITVLFRIENKILVENLRMHIKN